MHCAEIFYPWALNIWACLFGLHLGSQLHLSAHIGLGGLVLLHQIVNTSKRIGAADLGVMYKMFLAVQEAETHNWVPKAKPEPLPKTFWLHDG